MAYQWYSVAVDNAIFDFAGINGHSYIANNEAATFSGKGFWIHNTTGTNTGDFTMFNNVSTGANTAGARPCVFESTSATMSLQDITWSRGSCQNAGSGQVVLEVNGHGNVVVNTIQFVDTRFQVNSSDGTSDAIHIIDSEGITFENPIVSMPGGSSGYGFKLSQTSPGLTRGFVINGTSIVSNGLQVNNTINSITTTGRDLSGYTFLSPTFNMGTNKDTIVYGGLTLSADGNIAGLNLIGTGVACLYATAAGVITPVSPRVSCVTANGHSTMSGGTNTITFSPAYTSAPACTASDETAIAAVQVTTAVGSLVLHTTGPTDVVDWICVGSPN